MRQPESPEWAGNSSTPFRRAARILIVSTAALLATFIPTAVRAQSNSPLYWDVMSGTWDSTATNWVASNGAAASSGPLGSNDVVFNYTGITGTTTAGLSASQSVDGLYFANTGTTLLDSSSATSESLSIGSDGVTINAGAGAVTLGNATNQMPLALVGSQSWTNNSGNSLSVLNGVSLATSISSPSSIALSGTSTTAPNVISGPITDGGAVGASLGVTVNSGIWELSGVNSFSGSANVNGGVLNINTASALPSSITVTQSGTGQIMLQSGGTYNNALNLTGSGGVTNFDPNQAAYSGGGAVWLNANGGSFVFNGPITIASSGVSTEIATYSSATTVALNGGISGGGNLVLGGGGTTSSTTQTYVISGSNTYGGSTLLIGHSVNSILRLGASNALPTTSILTLEGDSNNAALEGWLDLNGSNQQLAGLLGALGSLSVPNSPGDNRVVNMGSGTPTLTVSPSAVDVFSGNLGDLSSYNSFNLTMAGTGKLVLAGSYTYTGATTINAGGILQIGNGGITGLEIGDGRDPGSPSTSSVLDNGTLAFDLSTAVSLAGTLSGRGALQQIGTGTTTISGANSLSGLVSVSAGILELNSYPTAASAGSITVGSSGAIGVGSKFFSGDPNPNSTTPLNSYLLPLINRSSTGAIALSASTNENLNFNSSGFTAASLGAIGAVTYSGTLVPSGNTYRIGGGGGTLTFASALPNVSGPTALIIAGPGTVALSNTANAFSGGTTINGGTLSISSDTSGAGPGTTAELGQVPSTPSTNIIFNGGTLQATSTFTLNPNRGIALGPSTGTLGGAGTINVASSQTLTYGGVIADNTGGPGALTTSGTGTLVLTAASTYSGGTTITGGTVQIQSSQGLGTGPIATALNGTLDLSGGVTIVQPLTMGTALVPNNGGTLNSVGGNNIYSGQITPLASIVIEASAATAALTLTAPMNLSISNGGATFEGAGNITVSGPITNNNNETYLDGPGSVTLSGDNTADTTGFFFSGGTVVLQSNTAGGTSGNFLEGSNLEIGAGLAVTSSLLARSGSGSLQSVGGSTTFQAPLTIQVPITIGSSLAGATFNFTDCIDLGYPLMSQLGSPVMFTGPGNVDVSGPIYGLSSSSLNTVTYKGTGTLTLAGSNIYTAGTVVDSGLVVAASTTALGSGPVTLAGGALQVSSTAGATMSGFGGNGFDLLANANGAGVAWRPNDSIGQFVGGGFFPSQNVLQITSSTAGESLGAFFTLLLPTTNNGNGFDVSFTYTHAAAASATTGFAFVLQNDSRGVQALGGVFGYGAGSGQTPIASSIGVELGISGSGAGTLGTALGVNGSTPALMSTGGVNLASGDPINVTIAYNPAAAMLTETLFDTISQSSFSTVYTGENLASILGGNTAYLGFTGSTGSSGTTSATSISNFTYSNLSTAGVYTNNVNLNPGVSSTIYVAPTTSTPTVTMGTLTVAAGAASTLNVACSTAPTGQAYGLTFGTTTLSTNVTFNVANNTSGNGMALGTLTLGPVGQSGGTWGLAKNGAGALVLTGASTFSGATTVSAGTFILGSANSSLGNTAINVSSAATFAPLAGSGTLNAGTSVAGTAGATLTLNSGSVFDMNDGAIGTFNLQQEASFTGAALTLAGATLDFDLNGSGADNLVVTKAAVVTGSNTINVVGLGSSLTPGTYNLITAASGLNGSGFQFANAATTENVAVGGHAYALTLNNSATRESVSVATLPGAIADTSNRPTAFGPPLTAVITSGSSFAGVSSSVSGSNGATNPGPGPLTGTTGGPTEYSMATIVAGKNNQTSNVGVSMAWRTRNTDETPISEGGFPTSPPLPANAGVLISDVLNLQFTGEPTVTDPYALEMTYDPRTLGSIAQQNVLVVGGDLYLGWLNPNGGGLGIPEWANAVNGDTLVGTDAQTAVTESFAQWASANGVTDINLVAFVGSWGVDTTNDQAWAVVDHASDFAVAVPEPSSLSLAALGLLGGILALRSRKRVS